MNFTYESIYNIIRDFRGANKSKYNNKYFDNPSKYYFKLFFYFNQGGLLDSRKMTDTSKDVDYVDNAITYLDRNMEWNRCELLELFIKLLQEINTTTPWYFSEVEGLSESLSRKTFAERDFKIEEQRPTIVIKCLPDAIDDRIGVLMDLYRSICFSYYQKKEIVPANLRKFTLGIYVFQTPMKYISKVNNDFTSFFHGDDSLKISSKYFELVNCEFNIVNGAVPFNNLNNKEGNEHMYEIGISFDDIFEETYNSFITRTIGDFIQSDMNYFIANDRTKGLTSTQQQSSNDTNNFTELNSVLKNRASIEDNTATNVINKIGGDLASNTKFGRTVNTLAKNAKREATSIIEKYSPENLLDTASDYIVDKIDNKLTTKLTSDIVKGNYFFNDYHYSSEMSALREGNLLGALENALDKDNSNGWKKNSKENSKPVKGNLKDTGTKNYVENDINTIIFGNIGDN